ncbi:MAG: ferritin family protein [Spirochaetes bacterium]|nr:ferritin family protein [Spirochaetota bacterium]
MDIYNFALEFEKESEEYYMKMIKNCSIEPIKKILGFLAGEERRHFEIIQKLKQNNKIKLNKSSIIKDAKEVFESMKLDYDIRSTKEFEDLLTKSQELEKKSKYFYLEKAEEINDSDQKLILLTLSEEEEKHFNLLNSIRDFYLRPKQWVENAEFNHLNDY